MSVVEQRQPKKIQLKGFKLRDCLSEEDLARLMGVLSRAVTYILNGQPIASHEELYKTCDMLCKFGHHKVLYSAVHTECLNYCRVRLPEAFSADNSVGTFLSLWGEFEGKLRTLQDVLSVMEREYGKREPGTLRIAVFLLGMFRNAVWEKDNQKIIRFGLVLMERIRESGKGDACSDLRAFWGVLERLDVFHTASPIIIERTIKYYNSVFQEKARQMTNEQLADFLIVREHYEEQFIANCFPERIQGELLAAVRKTLITDRLSLITGAMLGEFVDGRNAEGCKRLYELSSLSDSIQLLISAFSDVVRKAGSTAMSNSIQPIPDFIKVKLEIDALCNDAFFNDLHFVNAAKDGLEAVVNQSPQRLAEHLAYYLHHLLTTGQPMEPTELKEAIEKSIIVFRLLHCKDAFEAAHKQLLARRLLVKRSISVDSEQFVVQRLREECGVAYSSRLEGMFRDIASSRDTNAAFQKTPAYRNRSHSDAFSVSVITGGIWPQLESSSCFLPHVINDNVTIFEEHFSRYARKKKLRWIHTAGDCTIRAHFELGPVDIAMSIPMAAIFLQFDSSDALLLNELLRQSQLPESMFTRSLSALESAGILIRKNDKISLNFKAKLPEKVHLSDPSDPPIAPFNPPLGDTQSILAQDREDRIFRLDAAIVRHLKKKSKCSLTELQTACGNLDLIEERLDVLKGREYVREENGDFIYMP